MSLKKQFVILVALKPHKFEYYCTEPQIFYDTHEDAKKIMDKLIETKEFHFSQLKIQKLWLINKEPRS